MGAAENYDFPTEQYAAERNALYHYIHNKHRLEELDVELDESLFQTDLMRLFFAVVKRLHQEGLPIDETVVLIDLENKIAKTNSLNSPGLQGIVEGILESNNCCAIEELPLYYNYLVRARERASNVVTDDMKAEILVFDNSWIEKVKWPGLVVDYFEYVDSFSDAPKAYHLFTILASVAALTMRNRYTKQGADIIYPNQYIIVVGKSSLINKTSSVGLVQHLLEAATFPDNGYLGKMGSPEGLMDGLEASHGIGFLYYSEFGILLSEIGSRQWMTGTLDLLNDLYDCPGKFRKLFANKRQRQVENVFLNLIGATQLDSLTKYMTESALTSGFFPRSAMVYSDEVNEDRDVWRKHDDNERLGSIQCKLQMIYEKCNKEKEEMRFLPDTVEIYRTWGQAKWKSGLNAAPIIQPLYGRLPVRALKYSMVMALARDPGTVEVTPEDMQAAIACCDFNEWSYHKLISDELTWTKDQAKLKKVYEAIDKNGRPTGYQHILKQSRLRTRECQQLVDTLIDMGKIEPATAPGNKGKFYKRTD